MKTYLETLILAIGEPLEKYAARRESLPAVGSLKPLTRLKRFHIQSHILLGTSRDPESKVSTQLPESLEELTIHCCDYTCRLHLEQTDEEASTHAHMIPSRHAHEELKSVASVAVCINFGVINYGRIADYGKPFGAAARTRRLKDCLDVVGIPALAPETPQYEYAVSKGSPEVGDTWVWTEAWSKV